MGLSCNGIGQDGFSPEVITPVYDNEALGEFFQSQGLMRRHIAAADNSQGSVSIPKERPVTEGTIVDAWFIRIGDIQTFRRHPTGDDSRWRPVYFAGDRGSLIPSPHT